MRKQKGKKVLTPQQEDFCQLYVSWTKEFYGNWLQSYATAYKVDKTKANRANITKSLASRLLTDENICARINELLEEGWLNDANVDKQLMYLILQHDDKNAKVAAIREYNKLKARITDKVQVSWNIALNWILDSIIE